MALTPMMQQYLEIKENCKDCLLFYRIGDFYEMFFEDANLASRELEIALTGRDCGLDERAPMCGVPYHAAEGYISKLIEKGYKVAICEQMEDPSKAKGLVKREIIRIVTPGTIIEGDLLDERRNNYLCCLYAESDFFSLSTCDVSTGEFVVTSIKDNPLRVIDEFAKYIPAEIIVINNEFIKNSKLIKNIKDRFEALIDMMDFNSPYSDFEERFMDQCSNLKYHEILTASCLYKYLSETQKNSLAHIMDIKKYNIEDFMVLDTFTRKNLELTETIRSKNKKGSLLWILEHTETAMGSRLLRKWIEEPLIKKDDIEKRLEAVEELVNNLYAYAELKGSLREVHDMERIISRISCGSASARDLISLKQSLINLPDIKNTLKSLNSSSIKEIYRDFDTLNDIYELIEKSIDDNPPLLLRDGGLIKKGYSSEVDKLKDAMINGKSYIAGLEQEERENTGIKSLRVGYNKVFGYYIEVTNSNLNNVPQDRYIRKQTLANAERYITPELKEMEELILGSEQKVVELEYQLFVEIRVKIAKEVLRVQKTAKFLSIIDVLTSFAKVSSENDYIRPKIIEDGTIEIKDGRHPVVERVIPGVFVPNDTSLNNSDDMIAVITGPNMAGKSTFMRQVALIVLLSHIGCFVPAKDAKISVVDRIFTRIGASDDLSLGQSTFMVEMSEVSLILKNATSRSLILLDEVGRGTSTFDGLSIAWSVVEYLSKNIKAKTLFATHYHELTELEGKLVGVKNYRISVKEHGDDIIFLRKILRGGADQSYGIQVAKLAGLPQDVVNKAKEILKKLEDSDINKNKKDTSKKEAAFDGIDSLQLSFFNYKEKDILNEIKNIDILNITPLEALNILNDFKERASKI